MNGVSTFFVACALAAGPACGVGFSFPQSEAPEAPGQMVMSFDHPAGGSYLGVYVAEIDAERAKTLKLPEERGVEVTRVEPDSPAEKAGLKVGDVVLAYDGQKIEGMEQFRRMIRETPPGRHASLQVFRNGSMQGLTAVIGKAKPQAFSMMPFVNPQQMHINVAPVSPDISILEMPQMLPGAHSVMLGVETEPLSPQLAQFFGVNHGVLIRSVLPGSAAEKAGIHAGDVIVKADEAEVSMPGKLTMAVRNALNAGRPLALTIVRNRQSMNLTVTLDQETGQSAAPKGQVVKQPVR